MKRREFLGKSSLLMLVPSFNNCLKFDEGQPVQKFVSLDIGYINFQDKLLGEVFKISVAKFEGGNIVDTYSTIVQPKNNIQDATGLVTRIQEYQIRGTPNIEQVIEELEPILRGQKLVIREKEENFELFLSAFKNSGYYLREQDIVDLFELTKNRLGPIKRLSKLAELLRIRNSREKHGLGGAIFIGRIYLELIKLPKKLDLS